MREYKALVRGIGNVLGIEFPDFPGCISFGASMEEVKENGSQVLQFHVDDMLAYGENVPLPSALNTIDTSDAIVVNISLERY